MADSCRSSQSLVGLSLYGETYQARIISSGESRKLLVRVGHLEVGLDVRGRNPIVFLGSSCVVLVVEEIFGGIEGIKAGGTIEARDIRASLRAHPRGGH